MDDVLLRRSPVTGVDATARDASQDASRAVARYAATENCLAYSIVAYVPKCLLDRLYATLGAAAVLSCPSVDALVSASERAPVSAVVIDPVLCRPPDTQASVLAPSFTRGTPVILYTHASPTSIRTCFEWARAGAVQLVIAGSDDEPLHLRELLTPPRTCAADGIFVDKLAEHLHAVPRRLADAVCQLFTSADISPDLDSLVADAFMTHRSVDRWLRRAGLAPPKHFVGAARLLRAHSIFARGETCLARAARYGGFSSERSFARYARVLVSLSPSSLRTLHSRDVHERVLRALHID